MSEDTAHGQHFEPGNGAATQEQAGPPPAKPLTAIEMLQQQAARTELLGHRVAVLIQSAYDTYEEFIANLGQLTHMQQQLWAQGGKDANKPANGTTEAAS